MKRRLEVVGAGAVVAFATVIGALAGVASLVVMILAADGLMQWA